MIFEEIEKYKVNCIIDEIELSAEGICFEDIVERTPAGWIYLRELRRKSIEYTDYEWPGCAYSMQINVISENLYSLTFSETIDDFLFGLKQSLSITGSDALSLFINKVEAANETEARKLIRSFEANVRDTNDQ